MKCGCGLTTEGVNVIDEQAPPAGPDRTQGVTLVDLIGEISPGHVGDPDILLARSGSETFAIVT